MKRTFWCTVHTNLLNYAKMMLMPGKKVKNWRKYHKLRRKGFSKKSAARITNARPGKGRKKKGRKRKKK